MPILNSLSGTFPSYILPTIPFRRRSSTSSSTTTTTTTITASPPNSQPHYLPSHTSLLRCTRCLAQICSTDQIISKGFTGRHGRAYLVGPPETSTSPARSRAETSLLVNTNVHKSQPRQLVTGLHTVADISCALCGSVLGWKYVAAEEELQKYKVGKFILETKRVMRGTMWEGDAAVAAGQHGEKPIVKAEGAEEVVEFDSQDEDECEDLFMGIWSEKLAKKRRKDKAWKMTA